MAVTLTPYLAFDHEARDAMTFYQEIFGGSLDIRTFQDFNMDVSPEYANRIMHSALTTDIGISIFACDCFEGMTREEGSSISLSLSGTDETQMRSFFDKLSDGGTIDLPLGRQMWGALFGQVTDKYGVKWMVDVPSQ